MGTGNARRSPEGGNEPADLLRGWFGPDACASGTEHRVRLWLGLDGWQASPVIGEGNRRRGLGHYKRGDHDRDAGCCSCGPGGGEMASRVVQPGSDEDSAERRDEADSG